MGHQLTEEEKLASKPVVVKAVPTDMLTVFRRFTRNTGDTIADTLKGDTPELGDTIAEIFDNVYSGNSGDPDER